MAPTLTGVERVVFAVIGHNEVATVGHALDEARAATRGSHHDVIFVDSQSTDGTPAIAESVGCEVLYGPIGKGAAMRFAVGSVDHDWIVFLDADLHGSEFNIAGKLRDAIDASPEADMVIGDFSDQLPGGFLSNTWGIYVPLVAALFPEISDLPVTKPLSGFRALRLSTASRYFDDAPSDFGIESHLNLTAGTSQGRVAVADIGWYEGRFLYKPTMGLEIARALLDGAERHGRLDPGQRESWDRWVQGVVDVVATYHGVATDLPRFRADMEVVGRRPLPPTGVERTPR